MALFGWIYDLHFYFFFTVLQSNLDDGRLIMKGCVQLNLFTGGKISPLARMFLFSMLFFYFVLKYQKKNLYVLIFFSLF